MDVLSYHQLKNI